MTSLDPTPRTTLHCTSSADLLAALPGFVGFTATDSLFFLFFSGTRSGCAMRSDLPETDQPADALSLLDFLCAAITRVCARDETPSVALVITSSRTFVECGGPPWRRLARRIEQRFRRERIELIDLCVHAADAWGSFFDQELPPEGRALTEIEHSPVAREQRARGVAVPDLDELSAIPTAEDAAIDAVAHELARLGTDPRTEPTAAELAEPADLDAAVDAAAWLMRAPDPAPEPVARLVRATEMPETWFIALTALLKGPEETHRLLASAGHDLFARVPLGAGDGDEEPWSIRGLITQTMPEESELRALPEVLTTLRGVIASVPRDRQPGILALSAWLWWIRGLQTVAARLAQRALAIDADHALAGLVAQCVDRSVFPARPDMREAAA